MVAAGAVVGDEPLGGRTALLAAPEFGGGGVGVAVGSVSLEEGFKPCSTAAVATSLPNKGQDRGGRGRGHAMMAVDNRPIWGSTHPHSQRTQPTSNEGTKSVQRFNSLLLYSRQIEALWFMVIPRLRRFKEFSRRSDCASNTHVFYFFFRVVCTVSVFYFCC